MRSARLLAAFVAELSWRLFPGPSMSDVVVRRRRDGTEVLRLPAGDPLVPGDQLQHVRDMLDALGTQEFLRAWRHPADRLPRRGPLRPRRRCAVLTSVAENYIAELPFGSPQIDGEAFVAPTAVVVGAVTMAARSSIWYGAVARADSEVIEIGEDSNVQDGSTLHSDPGFPLVVGRGVTVGHRVVLHGARIDDDVLVGMGSVVMNGAHIGSGSIVAAGAVVTQGTQVPPGSLVAGVPAKVIRQATDDDLLHIRGNAASYTERLASARKVRPVVRRPLPPAGQTPGDAMD
ncbi:gamma carbonic anhydrase family protein [Geodermatophilus sp. DF01-2]|uniref:gamma carbonic anhydrase family protein n=1 Tax=Geodermatophilus sp. DF01-2 TaxID=2559610 RepID=UPI001FD83C32|nr:gamma carbonic anhydrase family protein [Geodermatophilus sp. DF01_2]